MLNPIAATKNVQQKSQSRIFIYLLSFILLILSQNYRLAISMENNLIKKVEEYVTSFLMERSPKQNLYHSLDHTKEVVAAVVEIGNGEKVSSDELELLTIAAWFHDSGYIEKTKGHEELSAMFASGFLSENNYPQEKIEKIVNCILATRVPQHPKNHLEKVLCDADLSHLGRTSFEKRNNMFRTEFEHYYGRKLTEHEWLIKTIEFLSQHNYFTDYAQNQFSAIQDDNLKLLQSQLDNLK